MAICEEIPLRTRIIPGLYEILEGRVGITRFRDIQIEDLLGRATVQLEQEAVEPFIKNKTVLVTGAGGSIGAELSKQIARIGPTNIILLERAEFALFQIDRELSGDWPQLSIQPVVADICDRNRVRQFFRPLEA